MMKSTSLNAILNSHDEAVAAPHQPTPDYATSERSDFGTRSVAILGDRHHSEAARMHLCILLNIVFSKFQAHKFLLDGGGINIYRLGHFRYHSVSNRYDRALSFLDTGFCFLLQVCLSFYVGAEMFEVFVFAADEVVWSLQNLPLAIITFFYSWLVCMRDWHDTFEAKATVYNKPSLFLYMDLFINVGVHFFLLFTGFIMSFLFKRISLMLFSMLLHCYSSLSWMIICTPFLDIQFPTLLQTIWSS
mmetsp:Transcript_19406/g.47931  ORF Transcript_19406/g.47931 Transcript_19406/m.47931 type:complete len:246 (+) Transcript_19406:839-1576(+)